MSDFDDFVEFWQQRPFEVVGRFPIESWKSTRESVLLEREERREEKQNDFYSTYNIERNASSECAPLQKAQYLEFWSVNKSWTYCVHCKLLHRVNMQPSFARNSIPALKSSCQCTEERYTIPRFNEIPLCLRQLTRQDIIALRPVDLHTGTYQRQQHGYRVKDGFCRVSWSKQSVLEKIGELDDTSRIRCLLAYRYLTTSESCAYLHFINHRERQLSERKEINMYDYRQNKGLECALWPHLYPFEKWCETTLSGNSSRESSKISFNFKILSEIIDYSLDFELIQFQYDRWLFNTVSGAISACRGTLRSPATALDSKPFSSEYWRWQHRYLIDAVRQYGYPSLFLTISPFEWTFPKPHWLTSVSELLGKLPTELPTLETLNIVHTLEQTVRGYLCGTNTNRWKHHFFSSETEEDCTNVLNFFYRIEFQHRGTAHVHLLVWLKHLDEIDINDLRADLPVDDGTLSFLVYDLQKSHKTALPVSIDDTYFSSDDQGRTQLNLHYPEHAFALKLRAYLSSILPFMKCSMDVQIADQKGMLMRYVSNYVSKYKDSQCKDSLYSSHVSPAMAAYRHLSDMKPCEPEMVMTLSSLKLSWSNNITKRYVPPRSDNASQCDIIRKYHQRDRTVNITLQEYLREYVTTKLRPTPYRLGKALVGVKYVSYFNVQFFFQYLLLNKCHFSLEELKHPNHDILPKDLQYFAACQVYLPAIFHSKDAFRNILQAEGHKDYFIANVLSFLESMKDIYNLWQMQVLRNEQFLGVPTIPNPFSLNAKQNVVLSNLRQFLVLRDSYYGNIPQSSVMSRGNDVPENSDGSEDESDVGEGEHSTESADCVQSPSGWASGDITESADCVQSPSGWASGDWRKVITITGKPGTGKTKCMHACISCVVSTGRRCLVATPTGYLASTYRSVFDSDIVCETVHSSFSIPIDNSPPKVNWSLSMYDVIFIDEISMIPLTMFEHILSTVQQLATRPILVVSGDPLQQQPIATSTRGTVQVCNIFSSVRFSGVSVKHLLVDQFRCSDPEYYDILNHLRVWHPTPSILARLQESGRLINEKCDVSDDDILRTVKQWPTSIFVTVSRAASTRVNNVVCQNMFAASTQLGTIQFDNADEPSPVFQHMRVIITQNRNKPAGVVNGQNAIVKYRQGNTYILCLPNGRHVSVYPVTSVPEEQQRRTCYPFVPGYALTICKCQGQTLDSAIVWFDCEHLGEGSAYVALSRVKTLQSIRFFTPLKKEHFKPVVLNTDMT